MPVTLFTGLPGSGKTAQLVKSILDLREKEPGRPIFQMGINGLKEGLAAELTMPQLERWWEELPPGSIICLDECQEDHLMPKDRGAPSAWVAKITKVRHFGMDFLLTTQHPANMSAYVRRLVDRHVHSVMRAKGVRQTYEWMRCIDDPENRRDRKQGQMSFATVPKETFDLYKSSSLHTMKVRTPRMFYWLGALAAVGVALAVIIPMRLKKALHPEPVAAVVAGVPGSGGEHRSESDELRSKDYVKWATPRVAAIPWSAPAFDNLQVAAHPQVYCISIEHGGCTCLTEQGTHYALPVETCRRVAWEGVYDPFKDPQVSGADKSGESDARRGAASPPAERPIPSAGAVSMVAGPSVVSGGVVRGIPQIYTAPESLPPNR